MHLALLDPYREGETFGHEEEPLAFAQCHVRFRVTRGRRRCLLR